MVVASAPASVPPVLCYNTTVAQVISHHVLGWALAEEGGGGGYCFLGPSVACQCRRDQEAAGAQFSSV